MLKILATLLALALLAAPAAAGVVTDSSGQTVRDSNGQPVTSGLALVESEGQSNAADRAAAADRRESRENGGDDNGDKEDHAY